MSDDLREQQAPGLIPESATAARRLLSVLGLDADDGIPDVTTLWSQQDALGRIPIGLQAGGSPVWLDLNDHHAGGNGPNGVLVGTDGSGKSTALQRFQPAVPIRRGVRERRAGPGGLRLLISRRVPARRCADVRPTPACCVLTRTLVGEGAESRGYQRWLRGSRSQTCSLPLVLTTVG